MGSYSLEIVSKEYDDKLMEVGDLDSYGGDNLIKAVEGCVKDKCRLT
jgi:hypothetical protein